MQNRINQAIVLAAGFVKRILPLTEKIPKPMIVIGGQSLIHRIFDKLIASGIKKIIVNLHYKKEMLKEHIINYDWPKDVTLITSEESEILETAGGIAKMLDHFDNKPFMFINGDVYWDDKDSNFLNDFIDSYSDKMDMLIALDNISNDNFYHKSGDFYYKNGNILSRKENKNNQIFTGIAIAKPKLYKNFSDKAFFSNIEIIFDQLTKNKLCGFNSNAKWYHIGTISELEAVRGVLGKKASA